MKLACSSLFFPDLSFRQKFERSLSLGYEGIEIRLEENSELEHQVDEIGEALALVPIIPCSVVVRSQAFRAPLNSKEAKVSKLASAKIALRVGSKLEAATIIQPEYQPQSPLPLFDELAKPISEETELLYSFMSELAEYAEQIVAIVLLEPINRYESHFYHRLDEAIVICENIGSQSLKICADFFHMNIEEGNISSSLHNAGKYLHHVHLSDSNRRLPGEGHIDFRTGFAALREISYRRYMALECKNPVNPEKELVRCREFLNLCLEDSKTEINNNT